MSCQGSGTPPREAYGRVSDPNRYAALHDIAATLLEELERRFETTRELDSEPDPHSDNPATTVRLVPTDPLASPLAITFTGFPGVSIRAGRGDTWLHLPRCGCDACAETVSQCVEDLQKLTHAVTEGTFGERLIEQVDQLEEFGPGKQAGAWHERWYRTPRSSTTSQGPVSDEELPALRAGIPSGELHWSPWPTRPTNR